MNKILTLAFLCAFFPSISFAGCEQALSGEFEFSECRFNQQNLSDTIKKFWGNPKVDKSRVLSGNSATGDFVLKRAWQCGKCCNKKVFENTNGKTCISSSWLVADAFINSGNVVSNKSNCPDGNGEVDDEMILSYVATDVSAHGAEFCLVQLAGTSWGDPRFFVYHQLPKETANKKLDCMWFCEPGYIGDRCSDKISNSIDISAYQLENTNLKDAAQAVKSITNVKQLMDRIECSDCTSMANKTVVLDYKKTGEKTKFGTSTKYYAYQQEILIGATDFFEHGIKARPILVGGYGGHHSCYLATFSNRKYIRNPTSILSEPAVGGTEHILCVQGWTGNNCNQKVASAINYPWCSVVTESEKSHFSDAIHKKSFDSAGKCMKMACRNGMSLSSDDNYKCLFCRENARQGMTSTGKCKVCPIGQCFDPASDSCKACSFGLVKEQMKQGKDRNSRCWVLTDTEEFKACVTGVSLQTSTNDDNDD